MSEKVRILTRIEYFWREQEILEGERNPNCAPRGVSATKGDFRLPSESDHLGGNKKFWREKEIQIVPPGE